MSGAVAYIFSYGDCNPSEADASQIAKLRCLYRHHAGLIHF